MPLPKKISPNPLISSTVEIRFDSTLTEAELLTKFFPKFGQTFPNIRDSGLPKEIKATSPQPIYMADYALSNSEFSISFAKNLVAFDNIGEYRLWANYSKMIRENLATLHSLDVVKAINRIGLRYISFFEGSNQTKRMIKPSFTINNPGYEELLRLVQTNLKRDNMNLLLQIAPSANANKNGKIVGGLLIDIDASVTGHGNLQIGDEKVMDIIEKLHAEEKQLFFSLLDENFLKTLNPEY